MNKDEMVKTIGIIDVINGIMCHEGKTTIYNRHWLNIEEHESLFKGVDVPSELRDKFWGELHSISEDARCKYKEFLLCEASKLRSELILNGVDFEEADSE